MSLSIESYSTPPPPPLSRFHHRVKRTLSRNTLSLLSAALLLIVIAPQTFAAVGTWTTQISGTTEQLRGVKFVDESNGWAVGVSGTILHTTDGGITWATQNSPISTTLFDVSFVDANNGWVVGEGGTILATTDGGNTWTRQTSTISVDLYGVPFVDANNGWAVGASGEIVHTSDGGTTWATQDSTISDGLFGVSFVDANNGWAVGNGGEIVHTSDGGTNWATQNSPISTTLLGVSFVDASNGWAVGFDGKILVTRDGGADWATQTSTLSLNDHLNAVTFIDANNGWAVGQNGKIVATSDGGVTWTPQTSMSSTLFGVSFVDAGNRNGNGWAVGSNGDIVKGFFDLLPVINTSRGTETLNAVILPRLVQSMLASSASAIDSRIDASFSGAGQLQVAQVASYQLDGQTKLSSLKSTLMQKLPVYAQQLDKKNSAIDWKQMLGNSSFVLPLNVDGGDGAFPESTEGVTLWGRGDYTNLSGKNWKGNVVSAQLGVDTRVRDDLLVGGLLSSSKGDVDYTASGSGDTEYKHSITSIHPYIAWSVNDINLWGSAGYGQGKLEIEDTADKNNTNTKLFSLSGGAKGQVAEGINLKSDLNLMQLRIDESTNKNIAAEKISSQRLRLLLEIERERQLETGVLKPTLEIGARYDGGDGNTGTGAVLNGSLDYTNAITGWTVGGKIHTLIGRKNYKEWGISGVVSKHVAVNGRGVSFNLTPSYGQNQDNGGGSAEQAWQQPAEVRNSGNKHNNMRINTRLGYGFAPSGNGLLTPYSEATFGESNRYLLGINWQRHSRFGMNLSGEHDAGNTKNHVLGVNWTRPRYDMTLSAGRKETNNGTAKHNVLLESQIRF